MAEQPQKRNYWFPGLFWAFIGIATVIYEWWALEVHQPTMSAWIWKQDARFPWFKWVFLGSVAFLMWHFFWQKGWHWWGK